MYTEWCEKFWNCNYYDTIEVQLSANFTSVGAH